MNFQPLIIEITTFIYFSPTLSPDGQAAMTWTAYAQFSDAINHLLQQIADEDNESRVSEGLAALDDYENRVRGMDGSW